ncbi:uncharacterized protein LOC133721460 [Rosa rugosa]|uniref:uncharacterized protein LOC133721458 n=1 Tax=Rosa rugosa TaxID=74645 RepID=UPI002B403396|nr:uncharacterized protein LOC133721458 [Rosa rugosa]XP_062004067.1 uncharacterized protein LOC133721460 [Rosa rugosa]
MTTGVSVRGRSVGASVRGRSVGASVRGRSAGESVRGRSAGASVRGRSAGASVRGRSVGVRAQRGRSVGVRGQRGRSVRVRARRAQSVGDDDRGRSLGRDGSQSRSKSPEGFSVLGAPWRTLKLTKFAEAMRHANERRKMVQKERKEGKYFGIAMKDFEQTTAEGTAMPPHMEQFWAVPAAAVIGCAGGQGNDSPEKTGAQGNDSPEKTGSASPDMFNFDKKQDIFD